MPKPNRKHTSPETESESRGSRAWFYCNISAGSLILLGALILPLFATSQTDFINLIISLSLPLGLALVFLIGPILAIISNPQGSEERKQALQCLAIVVSIACLLGLLLGTCASLTGY